MIFDRYGSRSKQTDVIIYDRSAQPQMLAQTSQMLYPIEIVYCAIEIKTTLNNASVADFGTKAEAIRRLEPLDGYSPPALALFAYSCESPVTQARGIQTLPDDLRPDAFCIIDPGIVGRPGSEPTTGYVTLLVDGSPLEPPAEAHEQHLFNGHPYPVFTTKLYGQGDRYCGDPARALLLFCADLLQLLSPPVRGDWLAQYMSEDSTHVVPLASI